MPGWRIAYTQSFFGALSACDSIRRRRVLQHMRYIQEQPERSDYDLLPPPWMPGTTDACFGDIRIRFFVSYDDDGSDDIGEIRFVKLLFGGEG